LLNQSSNESKPTHQIDLKPHKSLHTSTFAAIARDTKVIISYSYSKKLPKGIGASGEFQTFNITLTITQMGHAFI
jgi:hypothetical protein